MYCVNTLKKECISVCVLCMVHIGYTIQNLHKKSGYQCMLELKDNIISSLLGLNVNVEEVKELKASPDCQKIKIKIIENNIEMVFLYDLKLINKFKLMKAKFSGMTKRWSISLDIIDLDDFKEIMQKSGFEIENVNEFPAVKIKPLKVIFKRYIHLNEVQIEAPYNKKVNFINI